MSWKTTRSIRSETEKLLPGTDKGKVGKKQGCEQEVTCSRGPEKVETGPPSKRSVKVVADPSNVLSGPRTRSRTEII